MVMWIGLLFAGGSLCFAIGPLPGFVQLVGSAADASVFFAGSVLFTAAAALQCAQAMRQGPARDRWATAIQLAGTVFFNISTHNALQEGLSSSAENRLIWAPDAFGSICFLVASFLARHEQSGGRNLAGSVAFGIAAVASYVVPDTGDVVDLAAANLMTVAGALCFFAGALPLIRSRAPRPAGQPTAPPGTSAPRALDG